MSEVMIHETAEVKSTQIGNDSRIWQFVVIFKNAVIGERVNVCSHCLIENDVVIGNDVTIKSGIQIWDNTVIEDNVHLGANVTFTNDKLPRSKKYKEVWDKTIIETGASIGANATLIAPVKVGKYALIGAGSVITQDIGMFEVWYGNPAKKRGYITQDGELLDLNLKSKETGMNYVFSNNELIAND